MYYFSPMLGNSLGDFLANSYRRPVKDTGLCYGLFDCNADVWFGPVLPDGKFSNQIFQIWVNLGRSCNGRCWHFYGQMVYILWPFGTFVVILSILRPTGIFYGHLVHFVVIWYIFPFWYIVPRKIWQSCSGRGCSCMWRNRR
jgi:hypothetical protein